MRMKMTSPVEDLRSIRSAGGCREERLSRTAYGKRPKRIPGVRGYNIILGMLGMITFLQLFRFVFPSSFLFVRARH